MLDAAGGGSRKLSLWSISVGNYGSNHLISAAAAAVCRLPSRSSRQVSKVLSIPTEDGLEAQKVGFLGEIKACQESFKSTSPGKPQVVLAFLRCGWVDDGIGGGIGGRSQVES